MCLEFRCCQELGWSAQETNEACNSCKHMGDSTYYSKGLVDGCSTGQAHLMCAFCTEPGGLIKTHALFSDTGLYKPSHGRSRTPWMSSPISTKH